MTKFDKRSRFQPQKAEFDSNFAGLLRSCLANHAGNYFRYDYGVFSVRELGSLVFYCGR